MRRDTRTEMFLNETESEVCVFEHFVHNSSSEWSETRRCFIIIDFRLNFGIWYQECSWKQSDFITEWNSSPGLRWYSFIGRKINKYLILKEKIEFLSGTGNAVIWLIEEKTRYMLIIVSKIQNQINKLINPLKI